MVSSFENFDSKFHLLTYKPHQNESRVGENCGLKSNLGNMVIYQILDYKLFVTQHREKKKWNKSENKFNFF